MGRPKGSKNGETTLINMTCTVCKTKESPQWYSGSVCKSCYRKAHRFANLGKFKEKDKANYEKRKPAVLARAKEYYLENIEEIKVYRKGYALENKEKIAAKRKIYYLENVDYFFLKNKEYIKAHREELLHAMWLYYYTNRKKLLEQKKGHYQINQDQIKEKKRESYKQNPLPYKESCKKWQKNNPAKVRALGAKYRASLLNATPKWLTDQQWKQILYIYETCPKGWHVDHIIPLQGKNVCGLHHPENLQHLPAQENIKKKNKFEI